MNIEDFFGDEFYPGSRQKRPEHRAAPVKDTPLGEDWDGKPKILTVNGVDHEFFTIGQLATALNRRPVTIRSWEAKGILPPARYRYKNRRLYSRTQVEGLMKLCAKHGFLHFTSKPDIPVEFTSDVLELWRMPLQSDNVTHPTSHQGETQ